MTTTSIPRVARCLRGAAQGAILALVACAMAACLGASDDDALAEAPGQDGLGPVGQLGGVASALAVEGDRAWVGVGRRVVLLDASRFEAPREIGMSDDLGELVRDVVVQGDRAIVALGTAGLAVLERDGAGRILLRGRAASEWQANGLTVDGDLLYLADGARGLRILDAADPASPRAIGRADTPGDALAVALEDGADSRRIAWVADWGTGLRAIDVTDPARPSEIGGLRTGGEAVGVAVARPGIVLVADRAAGLVVVDGRRPEAPSVLGSLALPGSAEAVATDGRRAWVAARDGGLWAVDISDPAAPRAIDALEGSTHVWDVARGQDGRILATDVGAYVPTTPGIGAPSWAAGHVWGVSGQEPVAEGWSGMRVLRAEPDGRLSAEGTWLSPSFVESVLVHDSLLLLADGYAGVVVASRQRPEQPRLLATVDTPGAAHDLLLDGDRAFVADGPAGIAELDVADPAAPRLLRSADTPGEALGLALWGDHLLVADGNAGLRVHDRATLEEVASLSTPGYAWDVVVRDGVAFLSDRWGGLRVLDLRDPRRPREIAARYQDEAVVFDVLLAGEHAWIAGGPAGLRVLDVSDPAAPEESGRLLLPGNAVGLASDGDRAYLASGSGGLRMLDMADPAAPAELRAWGLPGVAERVAAADGLAYVATETGGLQVLRVRPQDRAGGLYLPSLRR